MVGGEGRSAETDMALPTGGTTLAVLGAATNGPSTGTGTITYSDGSTQSFTLGFSDWTLNGASAQPSAGNSVAATMPYRNSGTGKQTLQTDMFYAAITLQAGKAVARVTLPASANQGHLHVFAMTVAGAASSPPTSTPPALPSATATATSAPAATSLFVTGFESGDRQPTWANTVDGGGYPAGGLSKIRGRSRDRHGENVDARLVGQGDGDNGFTRLQRDRRIEDIRPHGLRPPAPVAVGHRRGDAVARDGSRHATVERPVGEG